MARTMPWQQLQQGLSEVTGCGEDRLSAFPDDVLVLILDNLDTRSALATAILGRRWAHVPRRLRALDLMVTDILPQVINGSFHMGTGRNPFDCVAVGWHARHRAMVSYTNAIKSLVYANVGIGVEPRCVRRLRLKFFVPEDPDDVNRLIDTAVERWRVQDLDVVIKRMYPPADEPRLCEDENVTYLRLDIESRKRIRKLTLGGFCFVQRLQEFRQLAELDLQDIVWPQPVEAYENIFSSCPQLRSVHLRRCCTKSAFHDEIGVNMMKVYAPESMVRELIIDDCTIYGVNFNSLPLLEHLACIGNPVMLMFEQVPRIAHLNLNFAISDIGEFDYEYTIYFLMEGNLAMTDLVVWFTGIERWISEEFKGLTMFYALRKLLVADVPSTWDVSWPRLILQSAPSLQVFHMNIVEETATDTDAVAPVIQRGDISWDPSTNFQQRRLEEFVLVGFAGTTTRWAYLVRYVMESCTALQRVVLVKSGRIDVRGLWGGWEVVVTPPPEGPWSDEEKVETTKR